MTIRIALVEDDEDDADTLSSFISKFFNSDHSKFSIIRFNNGDDFLEKYSAQINLIFMDIEMPGTNGMASAQKLRKIAPETPLIFSTRLSQFASIGYNVDALGYLLKPLNYHAFVIPMRKAVKHIASRSTVTLTLCTNGRDEFVSSARIKFVEVRGHILYYHIDDEKWKIWGSLKSASEQLYDAGFILCNRYCLVNPQWIDSINGNTLTIGSDTVTISRNKKKKLLKTLLQYHES
ncbi:LytTR family DNA-binding domain-containing protein [Bifidobacterium sp. ESL0745]|uniref:LytR/AlgR family response regulator transcription factor n=1 Tax=Bifidobacterium sp. ESL0745 TaxID=2983226 RepID=UPI0023F96A80|nr:LytTR family DNA-binding domain-containing protein [Bifidobacterium sp. ESL0745]MDF7665806.1 LytTR family DNA-binding domain-containing protein [Bifidobacterium sp. ESL0745]